MTEQQHRAMSKTRVLPIARCRCSVTTCFVSIPAQAKTVEDHNTAEAEEVAVEDQVFVPVPEVGGDDVEVNVAVDAGDVVLGVVIRWRLMVVVMMSVKGVAVLGVCCPRLCLSCRVVAVPQPYLLAETA